MIMLLLSFWTFLNALPIIESGWKAYRNCYFQSCWNASVVTLWGSGHQAMYRSSWWQSLEAKRPSNGFPEWLQICLKTVAQIFHCCCPGNFDMHSLLFDCSYWVYILLSNVFSSLWYNSKFPSGFRLNVCSGFLPCLINKREPLTWNTQPFFDVSENMVRSRSTIDRDFPL